MSCRAISGQCLKMREEKGLTYYPSIMPRHIHHGIPIGADARDNRQDMSRRTEQCVVAGIRLFDYRPLQKEDRVQVV